MQITPEIIYHDIDRSEWVESYILERIRRLDKFAQGITRCRVTLAREQASRQKGNRHSVMVEVRVPPGHDLAVTKRKDIRDMPTELPAVINVAFAAIERQVKSTAQLRRYDLKSNHAQPHGMVEQLFDEGYGFIRTVDGNRQVYFHRNSVLHGDFERLAVGTEVRFSPEEGDDGLQASSVQVVGKSASI
jgi:cold shock CspA family protein/ribosome-associated translation inhibitor RaiA